MLDRLSDPLRYFFFDSLNRWTTWTYFLIVISGSLLSTLKELPKSRPGHLLRFNAPYYVYNILASLLSPLYFKGDGKFYFFLFQANSLFLLFFLSLLNPFYIRSTHFPQLEQMTSCKIVLFSFFELLFYIILTLCHLLSPKLLYELEFNKFYINESTISRGKTTLFISLQSTIPALICCFNGVFQFVTVLTKTFQGKGLLEDEQQTSFRDEYKKFKKMAKEQKRNDKAVQQRIKYRAQINYGMQ
ncbi:Transmembrane_domain-containing protein [Hexamita inflata]|uniref:Transmembrane domain-containing protein n=1 Tax=Hexamita inflata TaxID=28002 RepID=A0AA86QPR6_9EUKA|nr:Transmembrane domain-containing protein [Hexamita inflata]